MKDWLNQTHLGDCRALMRQMIADGVKVQCIVTSPPYWGLRDYGTPGQYGLEDTWIRHVARMRGVFRLARQVLADDGLLWLNYGNAYAQPDKWGGRTSGKARRGLHGHNKLVRTKRDYSGLKSKDLIGMPWRVAFALQSDGWYLRSDVIWHKPNPMPESVNDRPTKCHEYVFMFSAAECYYYDQAAIREPSSPESHARAARARLVGYQAPGQLSQSGIAAPRVRLKKRVSGWDTGPGSHSVLEHAKGNGSGGRKYAGNGVGFGHGYDEKRKPRIKQNGSFSEAVLDLVDDRNARTVWTIPTEGFSGAHFATFPQALVARCILAGSRPGDTVLDIFHGSGTVGKVSTDLGRNFIGLELNPEYIKLNECRRTTQGMPI